MANDPAQERITAFWSLVAPGYEAHPGNVPSPDSAERAAWESAVRDLLPPAPADVLDIATGTGFLAVIAAELGHRVTAIDLSEAMLAEAQDAARRRGLRVALEQRDAVETGLPSEGFDAVICRHFMWTLREPERALRHWLHLLRPEGRAIAIDSWWFRAAPEERTADDDAADSGAEVFDQHYTAETRAVLPVMQLAGADQVADLFRAAGFVNVTVGDLGAVHALAESPPAADPWYVVVGYRPRLTGRVSGRQRH